MARKRRSLIGGGALPTLPPGAEPEHDPEPPSQAEAPEPVEASAAAPPLDTHPPLSPDPEPGAGDRQNLADTQAVSAASVSDLLPDAPTPAAELPAPAVPTPEAPPTPEVSPAPEAPPRPEVLFTPAPAERAGEALPSDFEGTPAGSDWFVATGQPAPGRDAAPVEPEIVVTRTHPVVWGLLLAGLAGLGVLLVLVLLIASWFGG